MNLSENEAASLASVRKLPSLLRTNSTDYLDQFTKYSVSPDRRIIAIPLLQDITKSNYGVSWHVFGSLFPDSVRLSIVILSLI